MDAAIEMLVLSRGCMVLIVIFWAVFPYFAWLWVLASHQARKSKKPNKGLEDLGPKISNWEDVRFTGTTRSTQKDKSSQNKSRKLNEIEMIYRQGRSNIPIF